MSAIIRKCSIQAICVICCFEEVTAQENVIAVRDLVPMRAAMDDSMERIADMKDQFSQTIDPILQVPEAALSDSPH